MLKLNIGAGEVEIEGFVPIDKRFGDEAYPLRYESNSVDEIRASHILEHFGHGESQDVVGEWARVLKPGGKIRIAVPDFDKITTEFREDPLFEGYIFGGQTDWPDGRKRFPQIALE
jgi:predicted SAM-dependent methyltransferase